MSIGTGVALFVIGAILAFAVNVSVSFIDLRLVGDILMIAGVVVFVVGLALTLRGRRSISRTTVEPGARVTRTGTTTRLSDPLPRRGTIVLAAVADVALVTVFAAVGRRSHAEAGDAAGLVRTAWPFLAGLALGWVLARGWRAPLAVRRTLIVWPVTVVVGMVLRAITGQGVQVAFVIVAAVVLGAFLLGWRALVALTLRIRGRSPSPSTDRS